MKTIIAAVAFALCTLIPFAAGAAGDEFDWDEVSGSESGPRPRASMARQETLELPGLTACHQCEWRPKPHTKAALEQCGTTPDGTPRTAVFECGFSQDCDRVCNFVHCTD